MLAAIMEAETDLADVLFLAGAIVAAVAAVLAAMARQAAVALIAAAVALVSFGLLAL